MQTSYVYVYSLPEWIDQKETNLLARLKLYFSM